jgi:hypothetical protein
MMNTEARRLYEMRSGMVHNAKCDADYMVVGSKRTAREILQSNDRHCCESIRKFIDAGRIPSDWHDIELN